MIGIQSDVLNLAYTVYVFQSDIFETLVRLHGSRSPG